MKSQDINDIFESQKYSQINDKNTDLIRNNLSGNESNHLSLHEMELKESDLQKEQKEFHLSDVMPFMRSGIEAIVDDEVTKRFAAEGIHLYYFYSFTKSGLEIKM